MRKILSSLPPLAFAAAVVLAGVSAPAAAADTAAFFKGKTVTMVVPAGAGGSYDLYTRILARHFDRHIPGKPNIVVTNMPGAGGARAAGYLYNKAPRDGTWLGLVSQTAALFQILRSEGTTYRAEELSYVGRMSSSNGVVSVWHQAPAKTLEEAKTKEIIFGSSGKGSQTYITPTMMRNLLGYKFRVVSGYRGAAKTLLAMEQGEVHGRTGSIEVFRGTRPEWLRDRKVLIWAEIGLEKSPDLPGVPLVTDLAKTPADKEVVRLLSSYTALGFHFGGPPAIPKDRLAALRAAFDATMKDPGLIAEMKKHNLEHRAASGATVEEIVRETVSASPTLIARAKKVLDW